MKGVHHDKETNRRRFLKYLLSSPVFAGALGVPALEGALAAEIDALITSPDEALNVFDFEAVAKDVLPPAHWGYMATGTDDDRTLMANRKGFEKFGIRARRLVNVSKIDTSVTLFSETLNSPLMISPCGSQRAFHPDGEEATARGALAQDTKMMLSTVATTSIEKVIETRQAPVWYQLYPTNQWEVSKALVRRAEAAGAPAIVFTIDRSASVNRETAERFARIDTRDCSMCHLQAGGFEGDGKNGFERNVRRKPMFDGLDLGDVTGGNSPYLTWEFVKRLRDFTDRKLLLKGIVTAEDAALAIQHNVDGIIVSNHGGRTGASGISTIEVLAEIVAEVDGRMPVLIDSGFRRGTDIFKAMAMGATAVCIGRPYLWGLSAFGEAGVSKVIELMNREFVLAMQQSGQTDAEAIPADVIRRLG